MDKKAFSERMLDETFAFARLALSNAILLNGAAATAVAAFLANHPGPIKVGMHNAILRFAVGAGLGGVASALAYCGQRLDWEVSIGRSHGRLASGLISATIITGALAYILFFFGCYAASSGF